MEMNDLLKSFELMRIALVADNNRVFKEVNEKIISELDLKSVGREGYGLSRDIDQKIDLLISHLDTLQEVVPRPNTQVPNDKDGDHFFSSKHVMWMRR